MAAENHAIWRISHHNVENELTQVLGPALEHMNACLAGWAQAGETQLRLAKQWPVMTTELAGEGKRIVGDYDPGLTRVSEAQSRAGGQREVYGNKRAAQY